MKKKTIVLGITGGIAAYKACELVRELVKCGADTHVILTEAAKHFVTPLTLQTLSRNPVHYNMFDLSSPEPSHLTISPSRPATTPSAGRHFTNHISLADMADIIIVAPACANTIAKVAGGICDDLLTTTILATKAPVAFAPSMNVNMWENPLTAENVAKLKKLGYHFIAPEKGELACGYKGVGRMADIEKIVNFAGKLLR